MEEVRAPTWSVCPKECVDDGLELLGWTREQVDIAPDSNLSGYVLITKKVSEVEDEKE